MKNASQWFVISIVLFGVMLKLPKSLTLNIGLIRYQAVFDYSEITDVVVLDDDGSSQLVELEQTFTLITDMYPDSDTAWLGLGLIKFVQRDEIASYDIWQSKINNRDTLNKIGSFYQYQGDYKRALSIYSHALSKPGSIGLSTLYYQIGYINQFHSMPVDLYGAASAYENAIEIDDFHPEEWRKAETYNYLGNIYLELGSLADALEYYTRSLGVDPNQYWTLVNYARVLWQMGMTSQAKNALKEAMEIDSSIVDAHLNYARILLSEGRTGEAIDSYKVVLRIDPDNEEANRTLVKFEE